MTESAYWLTLIYTWLHFLTHMHARMTSWHLPTENFDQPAHQQRISSSETSIVPAGSRLCGVCTEAPTDWIFRCCFHCRTWQSLSYKNQNHDCFLYHNFSNIISVCSHDIRRVKRSLSVLCIRAFWSVIIDIVSNFCTMHNVSDEDWSDCIDCIRP